MSMDVRTLTGTEAEAASVALDAHLLKLKAELVAAGARSFECVYIDEDGIARSFVRGDDDDG